MESNKENIPFTYVRGKCKINGRTDNDRKNLKLEIILHWTWKIILACTALLSIIYRIFYY